MSSLLLAATPALASYNPIQASDDRCDRVAGREKDRCLSIAKRNQRLRLRQARNTYTRGQTQRERRSLQQFNRNTNIRRRGNADLSRLRAHDTTGVSARRLINRRDEDARNACRGLDGTAKYLCIRTETRAARRGNVR